MNHIAGRINLRLESRNEGKLKSYESCRDIRAWSHDIQRRNLYLRDWIKADMPICVLPTGALARFMRTMTCRSRCRVPPRCHQNCKSKVVLESICNSCHAMKSCLKNEHFEKYFNDEEFETSHWPCERCLEALKSLKMFWKIIIEKIFNVTVPKDDDIDQKRCHGTESVRTVAKIWQSEMTQQAMFVKNISYMNRSPDFRNPCIWEEKRISINETVPCNTSSSQDHKSYGVIRSTGKTEFKNINILKSYKAKSTDTDYLSNPLVNRSNRTSSLNNRRHSKCSTRKAKTVDAGCECNLVNEEINSQKTILLNLEEKCFCQKQDIDKLKRENSSLRVELQNVHFKDSSWKSANCTPSKCTVSKRCPSKCTPSKCSPSKCTNPSRHDSITTLPKPAECCADDSVNTNPVKGVESEMIITMKSGKNEDYGHISLLQVLHKTNSPDMRDFNLQPCSNKKEDPIELLTKVQHTFGAIVKREMGIAHTKRESKCDIDASFSTVNVCKSPSSCSTTTLASSDSVFVTGF